MKNILFSFISLLFFQFSIGQNIVDSKYNEVLDDMYNSDYDLAINKIKELKSLFKTVPPKITYLEILINAEIIQKDPLNDFAFLSETRYITAKYLKDNIDRQNENYYKIQRVIDQLNYYPKDKATFDANKELERIRLEEELKDSLVKLYNKSDLNQVSMRIKEEFYRFFQKGEFEKTEVYKARIDTDGEIVFDSICHKIIDAKIKGFENNIVADISKYDADGEFYSLSFLIKSETFNDTVKVNIDKAEEFKNEFAESSFIRLPINETDWVFINNNLFPSLLFLGKESIVFNLPPKNMKQLSFSSKDLGFLNEIIQSDFKYDFNSYQLRKKERKILEYNKYLQEGDTNLEKGNSSEALRLYKLANKNINNEFIRNKIAVTNRLIQEYNIYINEFNENYSYCSINIKNKVLLNEVSLKNLTEIKKKYGEKYKDCFDFFNKNINDQWSIINANNPFKLLKEKEVISTEDKLLLTKIIDLRKEINRFLKFEESIVLHMITNNSQSLKILKEDDINLIIETIISSNPN